MEFMMSLLQASLETNRQRENHVKMLDFCYLRISGHRLTSGESREKADCLIAKVDGPG